VLLPAVDDFRPQAQESPWLVARLSQTTSALWRAGSAETDVSTTFWIGGYFLRS